MEELKQILDASPGTCPAYSHAGRFTQLLRTCPLQKEAIVALEAKFGSEDGSIEKATGMNINLFVPIGGGISFGCATYRGTPKPTGDSSFGKPVMGGVCPLEEQVIDQLLQITL